MSRESCLCHVSFASPFVGFPIIIMLRLAEIIQCLKYNIHTNTEIRVNIIVKVYNRISMCDLITISDIFCKYTYLICVPSKKFQTLLSKFSKSL